MQRDKILDIMKALTIIMMVIGHTNCMFKGFIYLFHMAVFFMISGFFFDARRCADTKYFLDGCRKRVIGLYFPYVIISEIYLCFNNILIKFNLYATSINVDEINTITHGSTSAHEIMSITQILKRMVNVFLFFGNPELFGAAWFLRTLFFVSIYCLGFFAVLKKFGIRNQCLFALFNLLLGTIWNYFDLPGTIIGQLFTCSFLYMVGSITSHLQLMKRVNSLERAIVLLTVSFFCLLIINNGNKYDELISLGANSFPDVIVLVMASLLGWCFVYSLSYIISIAIPNISNTLSFIGKHTLIIMAVHFLAFKIVSLVIIVTEKMPIYFLAAFPVVKQDGLWWILYTTVGVTIPLLLWKFGSIFRNRIIKIRSKN